MQMINEGEIINAPPLPLDIIELEREYGLWTMGAKLTSEQIGAAIFLHQENYSTFLVETQSEYKTEELPRMYSHKMALGLASLQYPNRVKAVMNLSKEHRNESDTLELLELASNDDPSPLANVITEFDDSFVPSWNLGRTNNYENNYHN